MIKPEEQLALLQCPQCDRWFVDSADHEGEACPLCFEGYNPPPEVEEGRVLANVIDYKPR